MAQKHFSDSFNKLTNDQKNIFDTLTNENSLKKLYFLDRAGGCGKTFLYKTLIYYFISIGKNIVSMAWTGIASILLPF